MIHVGGSTEEGDGSGEMNTSGDADSGSGRVGMYETETSGDGETNPEKEDFLFLTLNFRLDNPYLDRKYNRKTNTVW